MKSMNKIISLFVVFVGLAVLCASANAFTPAEYSWDAHTLTLYHLNEGTGTLVQSADANTLMDGYFTGSTLPQWTTGRFGNGVQFSSGFNMGAIEMPFGLLNQSHFTLEMYIKSVGDWIVPTAGDNWIGDLWFDGDVQLMIKILNNGRARVRFERNDVAVDTYYDAVEGIDGTTFGVPANEWTHIAVTYDWTGVEGGHGTIMSIYVNGELVAQNTGYAQLYNSTISYVGRLQYNVPCANMIVDEIRISDIVRTSFGAPECGSWGYLAGDVNKDCYVNFKDFAQMAEDWLLCTHPSDPFNCENAL
jgi:hypothetical protein